MHACAHVSDLNEMVYNAIEIKFYLKMWQYIEFSVECFLFVIWGFFGKSWAFQQQRKGWMSGG